MSAEAAPVALAMVGRRLRLVDDRGRVLGSQVNLFAEQVADAPATVHVTLAEVPIAGAPGAER